MRQPHDHLTASRQSACLVINPITVEGFAALLNCTLVDRVRLHDGPDLKLFILVSWDRSFRLLLGPPGYPLMIIFCFRFPEVLFDRPGISICHAIQCICWALVYDSSYLLNLIYLLTVKIR